MTRPFRFGLCHWELGDSNAWRDYMRKAEGLGYSTVLFPDHMVRTDAGIVAAMATAAAVTSTLHVGTLVADNDFRHPAILAKEIATVDALSGGRVEVGIGAGWADIDYDYLGMTFDRPALRIARLAEAIEVMKLAWSGEPMKYDGTHYHSNCEYEATPRPSRRPHPTLLVGGGGPKMLSLAALEADIISINSVKRTGDRIETAQKVSAQTIGLDAVDEAIEIIRTAAGPRFSEIELNVFATAAMITNDESRSALAAAPGLSKLLNNARNTVRALVGTVGEVIDILQERRERFGISYIVLPMHAIDAFAPVVAALSCT